jgi:hypothetical protein
MTGTDRTPSRRHRVARQLAWGLALAAMLGAAGGGAARAAEKPAIAAAAAAKTHAANAFLDRLLGFWLGEGEFQGTTIRDQFQAGRALDGTFVVIQTHEIDGADFQSDMYVGWDPAESRYELYFFSNFTGFGPQLPVRVMSGYRSGNKLIFEERRSLPLPRRFTFEFVDPETFVLTKIVYFPTEQLLSTEEFVQQDPVYR